VALNRGCHLYSAGRPSRSALAHILVYLIKPQKLYKQFFFVVKAIALKQQISIFYPQILSTEASFYIYDRLVIDTNVTDIVCVFNLRIIF